MGLLSAWTKAISSIELRVWDGANGCEIVNKVDDNEVDEVSADAGTVIEVVVVDFGICTTFSSSRAGGGGIETEGSSLSCGRSKLSSSSSLRGSVSESIVGACICSDNNVTTGSSHV